GSAETTPGELSLAIVPYQTSDAPGGVGTQIPTDATPPFSTDVAKPDMSSMTVTSAPVTPSTNPTGGTGTTSVPPVTQAAGATTSTGPATPSVMAGNVPAASAVAPASAPLIASGQAAPTNSGLSPAASGAPNADNT